MFTISIQRGSGYLLASATGHGNLTDLCGMGALVAEVARRHGCDKALIDLLAVTPGLTPAEHEELGRFMAKTLAGFQIAAVVPSPDRILTGEKAAQDAGLHLRTFTDLIEAETWVLEGAGR